MSAGAGGTRSDLRGYLDRNDITWCEDASNEDPKFDRVKARRALAELSDLGIDADIIASVTDNLALANDTLNHYTVEAAAQAVKVDRGDVILPGGVDLVPAEVLFRLRRAALQFVGGGAYPPRADAVTNVFSDCDSQTLNGCLITRTKDNRWRVTREFNAVKDLECPSHAVWDQRWQLDGNHESDLRICALGEAVSTCKHWRESGLPRTSLTSSPAVWRGQKLVAAPLAGLANGWSAKLAPNRDDFAAFLIRR